MTKQELLKLLSQYRDLIENKEYEKLFKILHDREDDSDVFMLQLLIKSGLFGDNIEKSYDEMLNSIEIKSVEIDEESYSDYDEDPEHNCKGCKSGSFKGNDLFNILNIICYDFNVHSLNYPYSAYYIQVEMMLGLDAKNGIIDDIDNLKNDINDEQAINYLKDFLREYKEKILDYIMKW